MYKADRLYDEMKELERQIKALQGDDAETVTEYFRLYTLLIYNYAWLGSIYDIYDGNASAQRRRGNGEGYHRAAGGVPGSAAVSGGYFCDAQ